MFKQLFVVEFTIYYQNLKLYICYFRELKEVDNVIAQETNTNFPLKKEEPCEYFTNKKTFRIELVT